MKLSLSQKAALGIAGFADALDLLIVGAIPYAGDVIDALAIIANLALLKDPRVLLGAAEGASAIVPVAGSIVDFIPIHTITALWIIHDQNKKG